MYYSVLFLFLAHLVLSDFSECENEQEIFLPISFSCLVFHYSYKDFHFIILDFYHVKMLCNKNINNIQKKVLQQVLCIEL